MYSPAKPEHPKTRSRQTYRRKGRIVLVAIMLFDRFTRSASAATPRMPRPAAPIAVPA
jgi:hypothetical protein